jgi:hypothetical protein
MRNDMYKLICERPRLGVTYYGKIRNEYRRAKTVRLTDDMDCLDWYHGKLPIRHRMRDHKYFNDYLNPLFRFIHKQVGRLWDDVYSEICENITLSSTTRRHIRQHVDSYVELNVIFDEDGEPCSIWRGLRPLYKDQLYKDPVDGILKHAVVSKALQIKAENNRKKEEARNKLNRYFDKDGKEFTPVYRSFKYTKENVDGITFTLEETGERRRKTISWFKYQWTNVKRTRSIDYYDVEGIRKVKYEEYTTQIKVRNTASKKEILKYGLNG